MDLREADGGARDARARPWLAIVCASIVAGVLVGTSPCGAQTVRGVVRPVSGSVELTGIQVVAERASDGRLLGRIAARPDGSFDLRVDADSIVLRALRIGFRPTLLAALRLRAGETRDLGTLRLDGAPIALPSRTVAEAARCGAARPRGDVVVDLYESVRAALIEATDEGRRGGTESRVRVTTEERAPGGEERLLDTRVEELRLDSANPFRSLPADSLARVGFVTVGPDGKIGYRAPDAEVIVSESFPVRYCLEYVHEAPGRADWVGVGFRPARRDRRLVDVQGVLWLDRGSFELRRIEFGYVGLDPVLELGKPGGWIEYVRIDGGTWVAGAWELRMARFGEAIAMRRRDMGATVVRDLTGIWIRRGEVLDVRSDGRALYTVGATESVDARGSIVADSSFVERATRRCGRDAGGVLELRIHGLDAEDLADVRLVLRVRTRDSTATERLSDARPDTEGVITLCDVTMETPLDASVLWGERELARFVVRLSRWRGHAALQLELAASESRTQDASPRRFGVGAGRGPRVRDQH